VVGKREERGEEKWPSAFADFRFNLSSSFLPLFHQFLGLPTSHSTFHAGSEPPYPAQFADDDPDTLFTVHPPAHRSAWSLNIKGYVLYFLYPSFRSLVSLPFLSVSLSLSLTFLVLDYSSDRTLLLRKITDFIRRADMRGDTNPRETAEFKRLDKLITSFRFVVVVSSSSSRSLSVR